VHFHIVHLHRGVRLFCTRQSSSPSHRNFSSIVVIVLEFLRSFYTATIVKISYNQPAHLTPLFLHAVLFTPNSHHQSKRRAFQFYNTAISISTQTTSIRGSPTFAMSQLGGMGATPARRSARISQAGSVTAQSVVTTMTTGGTRQRKKGPLTKVKARKSTAYGASGRVGTAEELSISATGFAQAFQNQRGDAVARDDDEDEEDDIDELGAETPRMSGALNGRTSFRSPSLASTPVAPGLSFEDSEDIAPSENDLAASVGNTSKSFGPVHEAGMLFRPMRPESERSSSEEVYSQPLWQKNRARRLQTQGNKPVEKENGVPPQATQAQRPKQAALASKRPLDQPIEVVVAEEQARLQREGPPPPSKSRSQQSPNLRRDDPLNVQNWLGNVEPGEAPESEWLWMKYAWPVFWTLCGVVILSLLPALMRSGEFPESAPRPGMLSAVNARISHSWHSMADWIKPTKQTLEQELEQYRDSDGSLGDNFFWQSLMKTEKRVDSRFEDMKNTITELKKDLPEIMVVRRLPDGRQEVTTEFWNALMSKFNSGGDAGWLEYVKNNSEKLRSILGTHMSSNPTDASPEAVSRKEFLDLVQREYKKISGQVDAKISEAIRGQASQIKAVAQAEAKKAMIDSIRLHTLAQSNLLANYELTLRKPNYFSLGHGAVIDPTLTSATYLGNKTVSSWLPRRLAYSGSPPRAALDNWEEPGDCWCAAPNPFKGQAQLTVFLPRPVFPQQVTIEHLPMTMMPEKKITNAPRTVELWVETDQPAKYQFAHREGACLEGPAGWTCLGSFVYNIHASNHQQTFDLDAQSSVPVTKAMIRVTSNWGADHTCLYRVRLHGRDVAADHQYEVHLNDPI
jgi:SUN domain-containing protein 1/2